MFQVENGNQMKGGEQKSNSRVSIPVPQNNLVQDYLFGLSLGCSCLSLSLLIGLVIVLLVLFFILYVIWEVIKQLPLDQLF